MSDAKPRRPLLRVLDATPGSSIGKFAPHEVAKFLSRIRVLCGSDGRPLPGMDLVEDKAMLEAAYDDTLGVTADFNLNIPEQREPDPRLRRRRAPMAARCPL